MENYILYDELNSSPAKVVFKGRLKQSVLFVGIHRYDTSLPQEHITINVQALHSLKHRNVLEFLEWYQSPQHFWLVTELVSGGTLAAIMDMDGPMLADKAWSFVSDVAEGMRYIHSEQIILCNLVPSTILLDCHGTLKISDLSLSQLPNQKNRWTEHNIRKSFVSFCEQLNESVSDESEVARAARNVCLSTLPSPLYLAPEVVKAAKFSFSSDMWSLGCIFFEMISGRLPFVGRTPEELLLSIEHGAENQVTNDKGTQNIINHLLEIDIDQRLNWNDGSIMQLLISP